LFGGCFLLSRQAIELNGVRIELDSEQGAGSAFGIILPAQKGGNTE
jgi:hypothetical protein